MIDQPQAIFYLQLIIIENNTIAEAVVKWILKLKLVVTVGTMIKIVTMGMMIKIVTIGIVMIVTVVTMGIVTVVMIVMIIYSLLASISLALSLVTCIPSNFASFTIAILFLAPTAFPIVAQ